MNAKKSLLEKIFESEFTFENYKEFIVNFFNEIDTTIITKKQVEQIEFRDYIDGYYHIGNYTDSNNKKVIILAVELKKDKTIEKARSRQRNFVSSILNRTNCDAAIVSFYSPNDERWRLSLVSIDYEFSNGKITKSLTPPKRHSYILGKNEPCHTAIKQLLPLFINEKVNPSLEALEEAFSVEKVTKEFFDLYRDKYFDLKEYLDSNEEFLKEAKRCEFTSEEFAKKLLGQIVFIYFLQKKGWLGVNAIPESLSIEDYNDAYKRHVNNSENLISKVYQLDSDKYLLNMLKLEELSDDDTKIVASCVNSDVWGNGNKKFLRTVFETCRKKNAQFFDDYLEPIFYTGLNKNRGKSNYFKLLNCKIPFLNGGLFEPLNDYDWKFNKFGILNSLFSKENKNDEDGILDVFDRFNFTMFEDEPLEREVAVDPEMLGKIFESLLDGKDRKSKGAFYTPREIVHFMCKESLINYLKSKTIIDYDKIKYFVENGEFLLSNDNSNDDEFISNDIIKNLKQIDEHLNQVRIADPAVGSGAFPLGMINEIVKIKNFITEYEVKEATKHGRLDQISFIRNDRNNYKLKSDIIKNSIFAVDIESSAVEITKLRLWLSLLVEQDLNNDEDPSPLPNLDCNIHIGNSLVDEYEGVTLFNKKIMAKLYSKKLNKYDYNTISVQTSLFDEDKLYNDLLDNMLKLQEKYFNESNEIEKKNIKEKIDKIQTDLVKESIKNYPNKLNSYINHLKKKEKPWFIWELEFAKVFKENGGFDIVIGNPPYIKELNNEKVFRVVNESTFGKQYHQGKMDFWFYFLHKGIDIINTKGNISFITPRYWLNSMGAKKLIARIKKELCFNYIIDIGNLKVFDNVVGYHMIASYSKKEDKGEGEFTYKKIENNLYDINCSINTDNIKVSKLNNKNVITKDNEIIINSESYKVKTLELGNDNLVFISQGVVEASDKVSKNNYEKNKINGIKIGDGIFVLSKEEKDELSLNSYEEKIVYEYLNGNGISRYKIYDNQVQYLIYSDKENRNLIDNNYNYTNIKNHLDKMKAYITSSNAPYGLHRSRCLSYFTNPKIIVPSMFKYNNFAYDDTGKIVGMGFSVINQLNSNYSLKYILGILNSKFALYWFYCHGKNRGSGVDIGVNKLSSFPIAICSDEAKNKIIEKVNEIEFEYKNNNLENIDYHENELNSLIYYIYQLSEEKIKKIEKFYNDISNLK